MALYKGNTAISKVYLGSTQIQKIYLGSVLLYSGAKSYSEIIADGNTAGWYMPTDAANVTAVSGVESIWWDMMYGKLGTLGSEKSSGAIVLYAVYKITATTSNFFYTGCAVGDVFVCGTVKTCSATCKVQQYLGNHITQSAAGNRPTNQVFNGTSSFMKIAAFTLNQPEFVYMVVKPIAFTGYGTWFDGNANNTGNVLFAASGSPNIYAAAPTASANNAHASIGNYHIIRALYNGASSKLIVDATTPTTWNCGTNNMGGFTLGKIGTAALYYGNIQVKEIIIRKVSDTSDDEATLYNYLKSKYSL